MGSHGVASARLSAGKTSQHAREPAASRLSSLPRRTLRDWPVFWRLVAVIVLALIMGLVFGGLRVASAADSAAEFGRVSQLASLGQQVTRLVQALQDERDAAAALALADLIRRTDSAHAAVPVLVQLLEADPYELEALTALGRALLEDGRTVQALEAFARVLRFDPDHTAALYHQGTGFARQQQFDQAVQVWERVIRLAPDGPFAAEARSRARSARDLQNIFAAAG